VTAGPVRLLRRPVFPAPCRVGAQVRWWSVVTMALVALVALLAHLLRRSVVKNTPYLAGCVRPADALARLVSVGRGTEVDVVGLSLGYLAADVRMQRLLGDWLRRGASIRYLVQEAGGLITGQRDIEAVRALAAGARGGSLRLFVLREEERESDLAGDAREFHFAVFRNPDQLWLEAEHREGELVAHTCEYVPAVSRDARWAPRREDFAALLAASGEIDLA
jgi:hypothetical protein